MLIIGGGPAGSTCAGRLRAGGLNVLVIDRAEFPRPKVCAGWVTPAVFRELDMTPEEYGHGRVLQPMTGFRVGRIGGEGLVVSSRHPMSFGVRRSEFDDCFLRRSGARLCLGEPVRAIRPAENAWIVNERFEAPVLVAAGGHFCPVARLLKIPDGGRGPLVLSQEIEFEMDPAAWAECPVRPEVPEIYFCDDLLGYGWCIRKGNYLNVGLGRVDRRRLPEHVAHFCDTLRRQGRIRCRLPEPLPGHAYLLYEQSTRPLVADRLLWVGDAAGLAYSASGEGIRPAIESGLLAAETILAARGDYRRDRLDPYRRRIEARLGTRAARPPVEGPPSRLRQGLARWLLRRRWFVRHALLDRWFLHVKEPPLEVM
ncbi:MAG: NAD(P)/FAD-dependent oxidoreductase [Thermoguttaceae bacterium]